MNNVKKLRTLIVVALILTLASIDHGLAKTKKKKEP
jgi:hypothetical protein